MRLSRCALLLPRLRLNGRRCNDKVLSRWPCRAVVLALPTPPTPAIRSHQSRVIGCSRDLRKTVLIQSLHPLDMGTSAHPPASRTEHQGSTVVFSFWPTRQNLTCHSVCLLGGGSAQDLDSRLTFCSSCLSLQKKAPVGEKATLGSSRRLLLPDATHRCEEPLAPPQMHVRRASVSYHPRLSGRGPLSALAGLP